MADDVGHRLAQRHAQHPCEFWWDGGRIAFDPEGDIGAIQHGARGTDLVCEAFLARAGQRIAEIPQGFTRSVETIEVDPQLLEQIGLTASQLDEVAGAVPTVTAKANSLLDQWI